MKRFGFLLLLLTLPALYAGRYACILELRAGSPELAAENRAFCRELADLLRAKGFPAENITWFTEEPQPGLSRRATPAGVREYLAGSAAKLTPDDEFYLFSVGYISAGRKRISLATAGGRISGEELTGLLDALRARQYLFLFNTHGAALFEPLAKGTRFVVSATDDPAQSNPPALPRFFLAEWRKDAAATDWRDLFRRTGRAVEEFCRQNRIARSENACFHYGGKTEHYPFAEAGAAAPAPLFRSVAGAGEETDGREQLSARLAKLAVTRKRQQPDRETRALYEAAASAAEKFPGFGAVFADRNFELVVNPDKSAKLTVRETIFLRDENGVMNFRYFSPGKGRITQARLIDPDGSRTDFLDGAPLSGHPLRFDTLTAKCVLLRSAEFSIPVPSHLPEFQQTLQLQTLFPVARTTVSLQSEPEDLLRWKLYNTQAVPERKNGRTLLRFDAIPAYSPLPFDDEPELHRAELVVTTLPSWEAFLAWSRRMTARSAVLDRDAEAVLEALTKEAKSDTEKIRRIYDYLCSIRYLTEPVGAGAFRPRTPGEVVRNRFGDCKDKANALVTMAEKLGIRACRVLLNRGGRSDPKFPSWQFNHMLVLLPELPGYPDGLWLDPTDGTTKFGELPPGDEGKQGLLLKADSCEFKLVSPQKSGNSVIETIRLHRDAPAGRINGTIHLRYSGRADYRMRQSLRRLTPVQTDYFIREQLNAVLHGFRVKNFRLIHAEAEQTLPLELEAEVFTEAGNFVPSDLAAPGSLDRCFIAEKRAMPIRLADGVPCEYSQTLEFPGGKLPALRWKRENARLSAEIASGNDRRLIRILVRDPVIPPSEYEETGALVREFTRELKQWRMP